jgi:hypothetical protein
VGRASSVRRLSRVSLSGIKVGKPPIKVPVAVTKPFTLVGDLDPEALMKNS